MACFLSLKLSKMDADAVTFKKEPISVKSWFASVSHLLILADLKDQKLTITGDENAGFIGDFQWTYEALANIVKNSIEHTPRGGEITIQYEETPLLHPYPWKTTEKGFRRKTFLDCSNDSLSRPAPLKTAWESLAIGTGYCRKARGTIEVQAKRGRDLALPYGFTRISFSLFIK